MRTSRGSIQGAFKLASVGLMIGLSTTALSQRSLLRHAKRVTSVKRWDNEANPFYTWLSNDVLLFWPVPKRSEAHLYRYNIKTGFKKHLQSCSTHADLGPRAPEVSPNGRWLFWLDHYGERDYLLTANGSRKIQLPERVNSHAFGFDLVHWLPDSKHWLMYDWITPREKGQRGGPKQLFVGDVHSPAHIRKIALSPRSPLRLETAQDEPVAVLPENHLLVVRDMGDYDKPLSEIVVMRLDLKAGGLPSRKYVLRLPHKAPVEDLTFAPKGDYLAWRVRRAKRGKTAMWEVWVSRVDGSKMRCLGEIPTHADEDRYYFGDLHWLPDGKRLSFVHKESLYVVPIGR